jgi:hypothetical protein
MIHIKRLLIGLFIMGAFGFLVYSIVFFTKVFIVLCLVLLAYCIGKEILKNKEITK